MTPILLLLLLGAVDLGRLFYARITVVNAAREGAMMAAEEPTSWNAGAACSTSNKVMCATLREADGSWVTVDPADVALACDPSCAKAYGNTVTVTVTGHFEVLTPIMWVFTGGSAVSFDEVSTADVVIRPAAAGLPNASPSASASSSASATSSASVDPSASATASASASPTPTPCPPPLVLFSTSQQNKNRPVVFTSGSTPTSGECAISYWRWEFGDGTTDAGNLPSVSHDYGRAAEGQAFNVTLTVTTPSGTYSYTASITTRS